MHADATAGHVGGLRGGKTVMVLPNARTGPRKLAVATITRPRIDGDGSVFAFVVFLATVMLIFVLVRRATPSAQPR